MDWATASLINNYSFEQGFLRTHAENAKEKIADRMILERSLGLARKSLVEGLTSVYSHSLDYTEPFSNDLF